MTQHTNSTDVVIVGGGIAGSALALVLARQGLEVTVLEQQTEYHDRVRGEVLVPWGVAEAEELGMRIYDRLQNAKDPAAMCFVSVMVGPNRTPDWVYTDDFRSDILH